MGVLEKINWNTRKWNITFRLLDVYLHDDTECWGFSLCEFNTDYETYSLLSIMFRLPNGAERTMVHFLNWDIFYLSTPLHTWVCNIEEGMTWGYKPNTFEKIAFKIIKNLF